MPATEHRPPAPEEAESPQTCRRCELWQRATQAVLGEGARGARLLLVGEQPGDAEDHEGRPFVGPAGRVLNELLEQAGISRAELFLTNAVKHFSWEPRGKRRLHKRPQLRHIDACNVWLDAEIAAVKPKVIVTLGATALRAVARAVRSIETVRGRPWPHPSGADLVATYHPSALLRAREAGAEELRKALLQDLKLARRLAAQDKE